MDIAIERWILPFPSLILASEGTPQTLVKRSWSSNQKIVERARFGRFSALCHAKKEQDSCWDRAFSGAHGPTENNLVRIRSLMRKEILSLGKHVPTRRLKALWTHRSLPSLQPDVILGNNKINSCFQSPGLNIWRVRTSQFQIIRGHFYETSYQRRCSGLKLLTF